MEKFGIYAEKLLCKVSFDINGHEKILIIPCSIGFKQKDGTWVNENLDILVFADKFSMADGIAAGDKIKVSGRMQLSEYTKKDGTKVKKWAVMADEIDTGKPPSVPQERPPIGDIPF